MDVPVASPPVPTTVSVILPALNERESLPVVIARGLEVLPDLADDFELIVVDDGSTDGMREVAEALVEEHYPRVRLAVHEGNQGYGAAIRSGFALARHDLLFYTDADNQFDLDELRHFLPLMANQDIVVGFRVYRYDTVLRSMLSWIYNRIVSVLFRVRVRDVDCAFKLFSREVLEKITIESDDFFVDAELVAKARRWNYRVLEKGVRHYPRMAGETNVQASDIPATLRRIAQMWKGIHFPSRERQKRLAAMRAEVPREILPRAERD